MVEGLICPRGNTKISRGGAVEARRAHNPKVVGSNPTPATMNDQAGRVRFGVCSAGLSFSRLHIVLWRVLWRSGAPSLVCVPWGFVFDEFTGFRLPSWCFTSHSGSAPVGPPLLPCCYVSVSKRPVLHASLNLHPI
jgi:hypothetical protein